MKKRKRMIRPVYVLYNFVNKPYVGAYIDREYVKDMLINFS